MNLFTYFKETKAELKQVTFPKTSQIVNYTILVVVLSVVVALVLGGADLGFSTLIKYLLNR